MALRGTGASHLSLWRRSNVSLSCFGWTGLNQQSTRLWTSVSGLNQSLVHQGGVLDSLQKTQDDVYGRIKTFNSSLSQVQKELRRLSEDSVSGEWTVPQEPGRQPLLQLLGLPVMSNW